MSSSLRRLLVQIIVVLEVIHVVSSREIVANSSCCLDDKSNNQTSRSKREAGMETETGRGMMNFDHHIEEPKAQKPWLGYYDFLITEGSYKFWVVFQLFTIAVLIYSAFAAIYYAKYTINDYDNYDDYLFKRSVRSVPSSQTAFLGLPVETYMQIFNAVANYKNE